MNFLDGFEK